MWQVQLGGELLAIDCVFARAVEMRRHQQARVLTELQAVTAREDNLYQMPIILDELWFVAVVEAQMCDVGGHIPRNVNR